MSEDSILKCLIAFVLGFLVARMMRGNGLMIGGQHTPTAQNKNWYDGINAQKEVRLPTRDDIETYKQTHGN